MTGAGEHTIGRWLIDRASQAPESIAIDDRGVTISYGELAGRAEALAGRMREAGYGAGDRVATVSGNSIDHIVAFFACALQGIAFVPLSWRLTSRELAELVSRTRPALLLVDDEYRALAADALVPGRRWGLLGSTGIESETPVSAEPRQSRPPRDDDALFVIYTSGSEAAPKGVVLTHANCFWTNQSLASALPIRDDDVVLAMLPQFHIAAWNAQPLLALSRGATVVLERAFDPHRALQLIADRGVTCMMGVPTQYRLMASSSAWEQARLDTLRVALVGGETMSDDLARSWSTRGAPLTQGYGLTEAAPNVLVLTPSAAHHEGTAGRAYPYVEVRLVDPETGLTLGGESSGELEVRGPNVFSGYLDDPAATARAMRGEWLRTGDLARRDAGGLFHVIGRRKDIFISGGENVSPAEVERALATHALVRDVAVVGAPDPVWGERGVAFVVPVPDAALTADELDAHARRALAAFKVPVRYEIVDEIPRSSIDKHARGHLRERAARLMTNSATEGST